MDYDKTQAIMEKIAEKGSIYGLEGIEMLLELLGNPQDELKFVHVAGTNGKGSVIAYLASVLTQAGYKTGQFTSPAVFCKRESICINDRFISEEDYAYYMNHIFECADLIKKKSGRDITVFEIETSLAFEYFKMKKCDVVLLETGLGGLYDATNIIKNPVCSVVMPVSSDHTDLLGNKLSDIAYHKAGIIKKSCPVVSSNQEEEVACVLKNAALANNTGIIFPSEYEIEENNTNIVFDSDFCQKFIYNNEKYTITMPGLHQIENAVTTLEVINVLNENGFKISFDDITDGLMKTKWQGRFSVINRNPYVIIDGAHNVSAALALREMLEQYVYNRTNNVIMIAGMLSDKDYNEVIPIVAAKSRKLLTINTSVRSRELSAEALNDVADRNGIDVLHMENIEQAVENAFKMAGEDGVILAFGSFSFLAEFKMYVEKYK